MSKRVFSFRAQMEIGIAQYFDVSRVVWTLIVNSKLANQIARLVAILAIVSMSNGLPNRFSTIQVTVQYRSIFVLLFGLYSLQLDIKYDMLLARIDLKNEFPGL